MEPQDNKQLALQKAINAHEQAAAGLRDLQSGSSEGRYAALLDRIERNIADLHVELAGSSPGDLIQPD